MYARAVGVKGAPPNEDGLIGRDLDGYVIESRIGSGATGVVYKAQHPDLDGPVAVKVLNENLGQIRSLRRRFEREARALSKLTHEHVVHISDFGVVEGITFIAMELLEGDTLEESLQDAPIAPERALTISRQLLEGLAFAHERQIVHRDLKPANVFLRMTPGGGEVVKILDFGLAKFLSIDELSQDATLTRKGRIVGTPAYMAPEQITGVFLDVRADIYAAGIVLFEMFADRRPFDYERRSQLLRAHLFEEVPRLVDVRPGLEVHPALEKLIRKALEKDPGERYAQAGEMLEALAAVPADCARYEEKSRQGDRVRSGTTSVLISAEEREAATTGLGSTPIGIVPVIEEPSSVEVELGAHADFTDSELAAVDDDAAGRPQRRSDRPPGTWGPMPGDGSESGESDTWRPPPGSPEAAEVPDTRSPTVRSPASEAELASGPDWTRVILGVLCLGAAAGLAWWASQGG